MKQDALTVLISDANGNLLAHLGTLQLADSQNIAVQPGQNEPDSYYEREGLESGLKGVGARLEFVPSDEIWKRTHSSDASLRAAVNTVLNASKVKESITRKQRLGLVAPVSHDDKTEVSVRFDEAATLIERRQGQIKALRLQQASLESLPEDVQNSLRGLVQSMPNRDDPSVLLNMAEQLNRRVKIFKAPGWNRVLNTLSQGMKNE